MVNETPLLSTVVTDTGSVVDFVFSTIGQVLNLIASNPILLIFVGIGITVVAIKVCFRILAMTKRLAH